MEGIPNGDINQGNSTEDDNMMLKRRSSQPELGIAPRSCTTNTEQTLSNRVDTQRSLSTSSLQEFRQRADKDGDSTTSMKKLAMLRKQHSRKRLSTPCTGSHDLDEFSRRYSQDLMKNQAFVRLQEQLMKAQEELKLKDEEVFKLSNLRNEVEAELEELTASLFQEAHAMVLEANIKQSNAEKKYNETNNKVDMLEAEVEALKTLVITSTPSKPRSRRSRRGSAEQQKCFDSSGSVQSSQINDNVNGEVDGKAPNQEKEVDVIVFKEFLAWMEERKLDQSQPFLSRMYNEDVTPCLDFTNKELSKIFLNAMESNTLVLEKIPGKRLTRKCALTETVRICQYRAMATETGEWHYLCQSARQRIVAVCDFFTYIRYIHLG
ncbi:guanine nucleotide exchange factor for Rab-3A-like isoform X2 [Xenia sp. Carnegie-2017]|uniref:guanine nucleotide exchange factor for Rab-3A-like isoform X2 n=1 Tax=Xenia sp. Carnegie-2017 TaxID=2897299 RepID=UPI001F03A690|nr:guanine nucleotide exchange factor for Rab-3A-like isoform X2 [Xenia sp. Carnegie-2017]